MPQNALTVVETLQPQPQPSKNFIVRAKNWCVTNYNKVGVATGGMIIGTFAHAEASSIDAAGITASIDKLAGPVTTVGTGILSIAALIFGFKLIKRFF